MVIYLSGSPLATTSTALRRVDFQCDPYKWLFSISAVAGAALPCTAVSDVEILTLIATFYIIISLETD